MGPARNSARNEETGLLLRSESRCTDNRNFAIWPLVVENVAQISLGWHILGKNRLSTRGFSRS